MGLRRFSASVNSIQDAICDLWTFLHDLSIPQDCRELNETLRSHAATCKGIPTCGWKSMLIYMDSDGSIRKVNKKGSSTVGFRTFECRVKLSLNNYMYRGLHNIYSYYMLKSFIGWHFWLYRKKIHLRSFKFFTCLLVVLKSNFWAWQDLWKNTNYQHWISLKYWLPIM